MCLVGLGNTKVSTNFAPKSSQTELGNLHMTGHIWPVHLHVLEVFNSCMHAQVEFNVCEVESSESSTVRDDRKLLDDGREIPKL